MLEKTLVGKNGNLADQSNLIKVASTSRSTAVAGAIAGVMRDKRSADVQAIGAGAVNQAVKALAIARSYLKDDGIDFLCTIEFIDIEIDTQERTAVRFSLEACPLRNDL
jgi:stage V sporulation protein S